MSETLNNKVKKEFNSFNKEFEIKDKNNIISLENNEMYLIEESWFNELSYNIENNKKNQYSNKNLNSKNNNGIKKRILPEDSPYFIDSIEAAINYLLKKNKFKLIIKKLINLLYREIDLTDINIVNYYSGNNNLIIEFINKDEINALLILNPLEKSYEKK